MIFQANQAADSTAPEAAVPRARAGKVQHSIIGNDLKITGDLMSDGDITVHGIVEGSIKCRALTLGEAPTISKIEAETCARTAGPRCTVVALAAISTRRRAGSAGPKSPRRSPTS